MQVQVIQHVPFEGLGNLRMALEARHAKLCFNFMYEHDPLPSLDEADFIVIMGGPMSVNDEQKLPWLSAEKQWIREALDRDVPMLGICLGAQLIAAALGETVEANPHKEIGWFDLDAHARGEDCFQFPERFRCFHWHGETFSIPAGAVQLASSEACGNQAFQFGRKVIGLQFHPETTETTMEGLIERLGHELTPDRFVQTADQMRMEPVESFVQVSQLSAQLVSYLLDE